MQIYILRLRFFIIRIFKLKNKDENKACPFNLHSGTFNFSEFMQQKQSI